MTVTTAIKRDVQDMKRMLLPKPPHGFIVANAWKPDEPHGRYGYQRVIVQDGSANRYEEVDMDTQMALMRDHYDNIIPKYAKRLQNKPGECGVDWRTFDSYMKGRECRCGNFGHC